VMPAAVAGSTLLARSMLQRTPLTAIAAEHPGPA
jgi:hypothetical protein